MAGIDLNPRVLLHTSQGIVVVTVNPSSLTSGSLSMPLLGTMSYDIAMGNPPTMIIHSPTGDVSFPLDPTAPGGNTINLPLLGDVTYEVVLGPPDIPADQLYGASWGQWLVPLALVGMAAFVFMRKR